LLHPPYTLWHLSYSVIGAALAPRVQTSRLIATVLAFFLAVGLAAHALDELRGRPLRTRIPAPVLVAVVAVGLAGALGLGVAGVSRVGWTLIPFMVAGPVLVIAYNAELFGGGMHTDFGFAAAWGAFPVLTAYVAQAGTLAVAPGPVARGGLGRHHLGSTKLDTALGNVCPESGTLGGHARCHAPSPDGITGCAHVNYGPRTPRSDSSSSDSLSASKEPFITD